jgi:hypothetical protein
MYVQAPLKSSNQDLGHDLAMSRARILVVQELWQLATKAFASKSLNNQGADPA